MIEEVLQAGESNFLSKILLCEPKVRISDDKLNSCVQFTVGEADVNQLLVVKIYDNMLYLVSRERKSLVDSEIADIVDCKTRENAFEKRVRRV